MQKYFKILYIMPTLICLIIIGFLINQKSAQAIETTYEYRYRVYDESISDDGRIDDGINHILRKEPVYVPMVELFDELTGNTITYPINSDGLTYGTLAANYPSPDLIYVITTNGEPGYVYKDDFYQPGGRKRVITVYRFDGKQVIGEYISG